MRKTQRVKPNLKNFIMLKTIVSPCTFNRVLWMEYSCISLPADTPISRGESIQIFCRPKSEFDNLDYVIERIIVDFDMLTSIYQDDTDFSVIVRNPNYNNDQLGLSRVQK